MLVYWIVKGVLSFSFFDNIGNVSDGLFDALTTAVSYVNAFSMVFDFALLAKLFLGFIGLFIAAMIIRVVIHFVAKG